MLLKLGHSGGFSNDISANKAIILAVAASGPSLAISDAPCARRGDLIRAPGSDHLLERDSRVQTNGDGAVVHHLVFSRRADLTEH